MSDYEIRDYREEYLEDQARIGIEVSKNWVWPFAHTLKDFKEIHSQPDFDPETRHYCFKDSEMVGFIWSNIHQPDDEDLVKAWMDFPRTMPGHTAVKELLIDRAQEVLEGKGVNVIQTRVTTMWEGSFELIEKLGFNPEETHKPGYKVYYSYDLSAGKLDFPTDVVKDFNMEEDLEETAKLAALWYRRSKEWCKDYLREIEEEEELIAHFVIRDKNEMAAACVVAPNFARVGIQAAIFYIYTKEEKFLRSLIARVIASCINAGYESLLVDLINEHRGYEDFYKSLRFEKVAEWAIYEKVIG